jgi:hypothetical protein
MAEMELDNPSTRPTKFPAELPWPICATAINPDIVRVSPVPPNRICCRIISETAEGAELIEPPLDEPLDLDPLLGLGLAEDLFDLDFGINNNGTNRNIVV